jgi:hypothetical protein
MVWLLSSSFFVHVLSTPSAQVGNLGMYSGNALILSAILNERECLCPHN